MTSSTARSRSLFFWILPFYGAVFTIRVFWMSWTRLVHLETAKAAYFHYDLIDIRLWSKDPALHKRWQARPPVAVVRRGGEVLTTIAAIRELRLKYDPASGMWTGRWPCPWNAPEGTYSLELLNSGDLARRMRRGTFRIERRRPHPLPKGFAALTLESVDPFKTMKVRAPSGEVKDWRGLIDWAEYIGADALWVLGGQTPGEKPGQVWRTQNLSMMAEIARECRRRRIKFGVYVMCYLTMSADPLTHYEYAREVKDGRTYETRAISPRDRRRIADVAQLLIGFGDIPEVDYLGIDYIRNALGGYELSEDFYAEMPISPPKGWDKLSREQRMISFAQKKIARRDAGFIDAWQWWRARRAAWLVRELKARLDWAKPLWAFTLTWDKGWHHGQDAVMFNDAGIDAAALMLYEADDEQFKLMIHDWNKYVKKKDAQLLVGDVIDWPLHQKHPDGPKAFYRRMVSAIDRIHSDGPAAGVFIHDLHRALWGRRGPWTTKEWMDEAKRAIRYKEKK